MAHKYITDLLLYGVCLAVVVLSITFIVVADNANDFANTKPESLAVFAAGVGLTGIGFIARRRLRDRAKG